MAMTKNQKVFVSEYLIDLNATQAAIRAGYAPKSARYSGYRNLSKPEVQAAIHEGQQQRAKRCEITADRVLNELRRLAFYDPSKVVQVNRRQGVVVTPTEDLDEDHRRCIEELGQSRQGLKIKLASKVRALELLGRHLGMWVDRVEHSGPDGGPIRTTELTDQDLERIAAEDA